jgi:hypothetical protein
MVQQARLIYNLDAFIASTPLETLKAGRGIHALNVGVEATDAVGAGAVTVPALSDLIQPFEVRLMGSPVIQIRGSDLWALNVLHLKKNPSAIVSVAGGTETKLHGLEVPLRQPARSIGDLSMRVTRVPVVGATVEQLSVTEISSDIVDPKGFYHVVEIPMVLRAALGFGNFLDLPQPGDLEGILFWNTTIPTEAADAASVQEVMIEVDKSRAYHRTFSEMRADAAYHATFDQTPAPYLPAAYSYIDLSNEPIPKESEVRLDINAGVALDPVRVLPIYRCKA